MLWENRLIGPKFFGAGKIWIYVFCLTTKKTLLIKLIKIYLSKWSPCFSTTKPKALQDCLVGVKKRKESKSVMEYLTTKVMFVYKKMSIQVFWLVFSLFEKSFEIPFLPRFVKLLVCKW